MIDDLILVADASERKTPRYELRLAIGVFGGFRHRRSEVGPLDR